MGLYPYHRRHLAKYRYNCVNVGLYYRHYHSTVWTNPTYNDMLAMASFKEQVERAIPNETPPYA